MRLQYLVTKSALQPDQELQTAPSKKQSKSQAAASSREKAKSSSPAPGTPRRKTSRPTPVASVPTASPLPELPLTPGKGLDLPKRKKGKKSKHSAREAPSTSTAAPASPPKGRSASLTDTRRSRRLSLSPAGDRARPSSRGRTSSRGSIHSSPMAEASLHPTVELADRPPISCPEALQSALFESPRPTPAADISSIPTGVLEPSSMPGTAMGPFPASDLNLLSAASLLHGSPRLYFQPMASTPSVVTTLPSTLPPTQRPLPRSTSVDIDVEGSGRAASSLPSSSASGPLRASTSAPHLGVGQGLRGLEEALHPSTRQDLGDPEEVPRSTRQDLGDLEEVPRSLARYAHEDPGDLEEVPHRSAHPDSRPGRKRHASRSRRHKRSHRRRRRRSSSSSSSSTSSSSFLSSSSSSTPRRQHKRSRRAKRARRHRSPQPGPSRPSDTRSTGPQSAHEETAQEYEGDFSYSDLDSTHSSEVRLPASDMALGVHGGSSPTEDIRTFVEIITRLANALSLPLVAPKAPPADKLFKSLDTTAITPPALSVSPNLLHLARQSWATPSSIPSTSRRIDTLYRICQEDSEWLHKHPEPNSVVVEHAILTSTSKKAPSTPSDLEGKELESLGKKVYSSAALGFRVANYQAAMAAYNEHLWERLSQFIDTMPVEQVPHATALQKEALALSTLLLNSARHTADCSAKNVANAVVLRRHAWLRSSALSHRARATAKDLPFDEVGLFCSSTDTNLESSQKMRSVMKQCALPLPSRPNYRPRPPWRRFQSSNRRASSPPFRRRRQPPQQQGQGQRRQPGGGRYRPPPAGKKPYHPKKQ